MVAPLSFLTVKTGCFVSPDFSGFASMFFLLLISLLFCSASLLYRLADGQFKFRLNQRHPISNISKPEAKNDQWFLYPTYGTHYQCV